MNIPAIRGDFMAINRASIHRSIRGIKDLLPIHNGTNPVSRTFGLDRGTPIDRYYIERFLAQHSDKIRGTTLEIAESTYSRRFGGDKVERALVLHSQEGCGADIVCDLSTGCPREGMVDCFVMTQTMPFIYDIKSVAANAIKILKPGGHLLATAAGISQISRFDMDRWGHFWAVTTLSMRRLFEDMVPPENIEVVSYGNVLSSASFLYGFARHELTQEELDYVDPDYQMIVGALVTKPGK